MCFIKQVEFFGTFAMFSFCCFTCLPSYASDNIIIISLETRNLTTKDNPIHVVGREVYDNLCIYTYFIYYALFYIKLTKSYIRWSKNVHVDMGFIQK